MNTGVCRLCGEEKQLIKAHIIPQQFFTHDRKRLVSVSKDKVFLSKCPVGIYDEGILCGSCDGKLGVFDQEAQTLLLSELSLYKCENAYIIPATKFNHKKLKLFFISLLWRASVSSVSNFKHVILGDKFEQEALSVLRYPELDREDLFPVVIFKLSDVHYNAVKGIYIDPTPFRLKDVNMYRFVFAGYTICIKVDDRPLGLRLPVLRSNCDLLVLEKSPLEELTAMINVSNIQGIDEQRRTFIKRISIVCETIKAEEGLLKGIQPTFWYKEGQPYYLVQAQGQR
jgi:hypothetical protein